MKNLISNKSKDEIQAKIKENCLILLKEFIRVADMFELTWWVDSGTLLGACRNNKMIPWDDDIDIVMPREDYDKLCLHCVESQFDKRKFLFQTSTTDCYFEVHAKLRLNNSTSLTERECTGRHHRGMFLDIFPLDNCPNDINVCNDIQGFTKTFAKHTGYEKIQAFSHRFEKYNDVLRSIHERNENSNYIANIAFWRYKKTPTMLQKSWYDDTLQVRFEDLLVNVPIGYKHVLTTLYGENYMTPQNISNCHKAFTDPFNDYSKYDNCTKEEFYELVQNFQK